jgi:putative PEP-CTERM system histidine kinase
MRWRIKYATVGLGVFALVRIFTAAQELLHATVMPSWLTLNALAFAVCCGLVGLSRRRGTLLAVDLYPSQRVLYRSVTLALAGVYLLIIGLLAVAGSWLGVDTWLPLNSLLLLLAMVGAASLLLSDRIRQRAKQWTSVHFRRPRHDYRQVWNRFNDQTLARTEVHPFCRAVAELVAETFESLSVSLWLADPGRLRLRLGGSTALTGREADGPGAMEEAGEVLQALASADQPIDLNQNRAPWSRDLLEANPDSFQTGQTLCLPLQGDGQVLGLLLVGGRVNHAPFSGEDLALLKTIGGYTASRLTAFRLSERLLEAREFAALQKVSAFFVHDLKNTASTLSLMLKNLTRHFDNEAFREDALRAIAATIQRIEGMIAQLTLLRGRRELRQTPADLNALVGRAIREAFPASEARVEKDLGELPLVPMDEAGMQTVLVNLLVNAREATGDGGPIHVSTSTAAAAAVVTVRDHGPGLSKEFMDNRLFKAFQSTKKNGLGIGLYHARQVVEAHGGRIEVQSEPGRGATFRVVLPLAEPR